MKVGTWWMVTPSDGLKRGAGSRGPGQRRRPRNRWPGRAGSPPGWRTAPVSRHGEDGHLVAQDGGLINVVGDEDDGLGQVTLQPEQFLLQFVADHRVHGAERLIHEQYRWVGGERPGHANALLLAAGELGRVPLAQGGGQPDNVQQLLGALSGVGFGHAVEPGDGGDVVQHRAVRHQARGLHDVAHGPSEFAAGTEVTSARQR